MDATKLISYRKPAAGIMLIIGIAVIMLNLNLTVGMLLVLCGCLGLFWENIVNGGK